MTGAEIPVLRGDAARAVGHRGGHLQIIASAGAGKTEAVSQRVASLLADGVAPDGIVAFTFTERAADSLKSRIERRVEARLGREFLDRLNGMFVGTIHSFCFRVLQQHVPRYETYDVLDDHRLTAFLTREAYDIGLVPKIDPKLFKAIEIFGQNLDAVENELLRPELLEDPFREVYERYLATLEQNRFLTYGQQVARAVEELHRQEVFDEVHSPLRHLIVDEYQDVNPAQEALIRRLALSPVHLCVVGDDDQSIYQWRGADVGNIFGFDARYEGVEPFRLQRNRRSRPAIIATANGFAKTIDPGRRLPKTMGEHRASSGRTEVVCWRAETQQEEAALIARTIRDLHDRHGYRYRDIAILCRGRVSFPAILEALEGAEPPIPVQPGGRTNLFIKVEADLFGRTMCWLAGYDWRVGRYGWTTERVDLDDLVERHRDLYALSPGQVEAVRGRLRGWKERIGDHRFPANLVRDFYLLLEAAGAPGWDTGDPMVVDRLGTLARCSQVLVDYESTRRRAHPDPARPGDIEFVPDRGIKYHQWLARYIQNWARGAYEGFEGEEDVELDAVDLSTVHAGKGLEWPVVFVPALTAKRFPSSLTGKAKDWRIPRRLFAAARYEGSEDDERRLFYVAMTRARDFLSLSTFDRIQDPQAPSPFLMEVSGGDLPRLRKLPRPPDPEAALEDEEVLEITFSDLAAYVECGLAYRLRRLVGFQPPVAPEIGYGKAVHHVLRHLAELVRRTGRLPTARQLDRIFNDEFYLPAANIEAHRQMKSRARLLVERYLTDWSSDLHQVWAVERPFELHLGDATASGRADVILREGTEKPEEILAIVDYKTAADGHDSHDFQLQVYTDAGRREGLLVDAAYVHDLKNATRRLVPVREGDIADAEQRVRSLVTGLRAKDYSARPSLEVCGRCDVSALCRYRADRPRSTARRA